MATGLSANAGMAATCSVPQATFNPVSHSGFSTWVNKFVNRAKNAGISTEVLRAGLRGGGYIPDVVARDQNQFQTRRKLEDYIAIATSDDRLRKGQKALQSNGKTLSAIEKRYGVDRFIVAAIWGIESRFGERRGDVPVVSATATLAYDGRRGAFFEKQLIAALKILKRGDVRPENLTGSWAGAMGHTQFIPTSYQSFAVDFNGDGRRDVWSDDPTDALASTAAYLARIGWRNGLPWGAETGTSNLTGTVIRPQSGGPSFVVTRNYTVIRRYNDSAKYAVSVGQLADRLRGMSDLRGAFPRDQYGMSLAERRTLQSKLARKGYDLGEIDGVIGSKTRCAIRSYQQTKGWQATGEPSLDLLRKM